jgi:CRP/FNR family transcriptional regulator, cyclic AMP receptor protein
MTMTVNTERFATVPLFDMLEPLEIVDLLDIAEDLRTRPGDIIVREGDPGDGFYVISAGVFEVVKGDDQGIVLARLEELSFFGEMSLVSRKPCNATVICREAGRLKRFSRAKFDAMLSDGHLPAYKVIHAMSRILAERLARLDADYAAVRSRTSAASV